MKPPNVRQGHDDKDKVSDDIWHGTADVERLLIHAFGSRGKFEIPTARYGVTIEDDDQTLVTPSQS